MVIQSQNPLTPCKRGSKNCVSSVNNPSHSHSYIEPISFHNTPSSGDILSLIKSELKNDRHATLTEERDHFLHYVFTTSWLNFKDEVYFFHDQNEKVVHIKSSSRIGYYDFHTNRKRLDRIRHAIETNMQIK
ncbi:DUF1499 domain-containing protein [Bacillus coahuilensis]|uniref:DUF1499 domain-containing protein n=1 Tax=Bacillus coahuilensis TaxID=408580 RepID=UPI0001850757|nr:DUF1499 domain-containing protein [Bacillus coahuilensis]